VLWQRILIRSI